MYITLWLIIDNLIHFKVGTAEYKLTLLLNRNKREKTNDDILKKDSLVVNYTNMVNIY